MGLLITLSAQFTFFGDLTDKGMVLGEEDDDGNGVGKGNDGTAGGVVLSSSKST